MAEVLARGRALRRGEHFDEPAVVIRAHTCAAVAKVLCRGQGWEDLEDAWRAAMAEPGMAEHAGYAAVSICRAAVIHRDQQRADRYIAEAETYCGENELAGFLQLVRSATPLSMLNRGDWTAAVASADDALGRPGLSPMHRTMPLVVLGLIRARRGEKDVWPPLDEALDCGEPSDLFRLGIVWSARAEARWLAGDNAAAITEAEHGLKAAAVDADPWLVGPLLRWIRLAGGQPPPLVAAGPHALELAGDWRAAASGWTELGRPYDAALAQLGSGDADLIRSALITFGAMGAHGAAELAKTRLRQLGHRRAPYGRRAATRANAYGLTPREVELLALLRENLTDAEIAARLHIAPKTVGHHVSAVLVKLGVQNRRQATTKADGQPSGAANAS